MQWTPNCRIFAESLDRTFATIPEALQRMDSFALFNTISTRMQRGDDNLTMFAINVASVQDQKLPSVPRDGVLFPIFVSKKDALALAKQELVSYTGVSDADWKLFINFNESLIDICNEINCEIMQDALWSDNLMSLVSQVPLCPLTPSPAQLTIYLDEFVRFCRKWAIKTASDIDSDYQQQLEDAFSHVPYPSFSVFSDPVVNEPDSSSVSLESTLPLK